MPAPIPFDAPVTTATFPARSLMNPPPRCVIAIPWDGRPCEADSARGGFDRGALAQILLICRTVPHRAPLRSNPNRVIGQTLRDPSAQSFLASRLSGWAPIPVRLLVGIGFMAHGVAKLARGPDAFADILHALGAPAPHLMAWVSILTELL